VVGNQRRSSPGKGASFLVVVQLDGKVSGDHKKIKNTVVILLLFFRFELKIQKMPRSHFLLVLICTLILSYFTDRVSAQKAYSSESADTLAPQKIPEIVVTANRHGSMRMNTPEAISSTESKTIEKFQLRTAPEALMQSAGVFVQKTNHGGGSPFLRGLTGNQTLLLVDGIRLSNATTRYGPNQYFNTIDLFSIEKIEVLRGGGSVQYGSDAMGGTVQSFSHEVQTTKKPVWGGNVLSRIATQGMEQSLHGRINFSNTKLAITGGVTRRDFGDLVGGDTTGRQSPTGYKEFDFDLKGKILLSPSSTLTMAYQNVQQRNVPVFHKIVLENYTVNEMDPQKRTLAYLRLNQDIKSGFLETAVITASCQQNEEGRNLRKNGTNTLRTENDQVFTMALSGEVLTSNNRGWSANSGVEVYHDLINSTRTDKTISTLDDVSKRGLYPDGATMTSMAIFTMHTMDLKHWIITAGTRFNTFVNTVQDKELGEIILTPSSLVGNIAVLRKLDENSIFFVSVNSGFRAPNIDDLGTLGIVDFRYETPNFDLKPEHSLQYQIGYKYQTQRLRGDLYLYRNELYNLVVRSRIAGDSIEGYPVYQKENVERAYVQGAETAWNFELSKTWQLNGSLTYTYGHNLTKNEPMRRIPPLFGRVSLEYRIKKWNINIECQAAGKQSRLAAGDKEDNRIPAGGTPGWKVFNLNSSYEIRNFTFDLGLLNLFNKDYRYHGSGINGYGRSAMLTVNFHL
jgi:outer membrane cobalamin receptor